MSTKFDKHLEAGETIVAGPFPRLGYFRTFVNLAIFIGFMALMAGIFYVEALPRFLEMRNISPDAPGSWGKFTPYAPYIPIVLVPLGVLMFVGALIYSLREKLLLTDRAVLMIAGRKAKRVLLTDIKEVDIQGFTYIGLIKAIFKNIFYGRFYLILHTEIDGKARAENYPRLVSGGASLLFGKGNARRAAARIEEAVEKAQA